jgi:hypothetical protein
MKVHRGKVHEYLEMGLDITHKRKCVVTMHDYVDGIIKAWDVAVQKHEEGFQPVTRQRYELPAPDNLFTVNEDCEKLPEAMAADFHTIAAKALYVTNGQGPTHAYRLHSSRQGLELLIGMTGRNSAILSSI